MATLREYFEKDQGAALVTAKTLTIADEHGQALLEITGRLHTTFESNSLHVSFYVPATEKVACPSRIILNAVDEVLALRDSVYVEARLPGDEPSSSGEAVFTGRIYIYSEGPIPDEDREYISQRSIELGQSVKIRDMNYARERAAWEKPLAFISHDSRDKAAIAQPLALALQKIGCPVWYDEFSLKVGDSLRQSIETGLKDCRKCVFLLTPNFLANGGWAQREYDSIFTRELVEKQSVILPVWAGVSVEDVYKYSPILADRVAAKWEGGVDGIAAKLAAGIRGQ